MNEEFTGVPNVVNLNYHSVSYTTFPDLNTTFVFYFLIIFQGEVQTYTKTDE